MNRIAEIIADLLWISGVIMACVGVWQIYAPAGLIVGGIALAGTGWMIALGGNGK